MLKTINRITGTGLFEDTGPSPQFTAATLIFGENGRGKSTLASLLRSSTGQEGADIDARRTLGNSIPQTASFDIHSSAGVETLNLAGNSWSNHWTDLIVFDAEFVSRNVYAGHGVSPDQRAGLLSFAVGEAAVQTKKDLELLTSQANAAAATFREVEQALNQARGPFTLRQYRALPAIGDLQSRIDDLRLRSAQAKNLATVRGTPGAQLVPMPKLDIDALFAILRKTVADVSEAAALRVKAHIASRGSAVFEGWLAAGLKYVVDTDCPFCGNANEDGPLLAAYHSYFNDEYHALKEEASALPTNVERRLGEQVAAIIQSNIQKAQAQLGYWRGVLSLPKTDFEESKFSSLLGELRELLVTLANAKSESPLRPVGSQAEIEEATRMWRRLSEQLHAFNESLSHCNQLIDSHKQSLETVQQQLIELEIKKLEIQRDRHTENAIKQLADYDSADQVRNALTKQKEMARSTLNEQMEAIFATYGENINSLLRTFGAQIEIRSLKPAFRGQGAIGRTEYELMVRGNPVSLNPTEGAHFGNTLSEGDKRALAYAFFLAKVITDPNLSDKTVLIDDPVCSLDWNRRAATIRSLLRLARGCRQLIVLAHDAFFVRALGEGLSKLPETKNKVSYIKVAATAGNASELVPFDVEDECKGRHRRNIDIISRYLANPSTGSADLASRTIRPVLEGYLRNRFPLSPPTGNMLGSIINFIQNSDQNSPYYALKPLVSELNDINDYTIQFMHEDGEQAPPLVETELRAYCQRVLVILNK
ncbi:AAA family ATPase [Stenotrophomonas maltophilia]|uniref:AAA family ATPase n=1 Tax=Stenotrophomonas maltophilia TaxID=40324 RepID=UPI001F28DF08|nr:AAA family ATPase [Stenotrophomonas maltophilia]MCF3469178.1 AAA family ATPase [Stenotrophomonas maltophilia]